VLRLPAESKAQETSKLTRTGLPRAQRQNHQAMGPPTTVPGAISKALPDVERNYLRTEKTTGPPLSWLQEPGVLQMLALVRTELTAAPPAVKHAASAVQAAQHMNIDQIEEMDGGPARAVR
jgi:hypothetical protein